MVLQFPVIAIQEKAESVVTGLQGVVRALFQHGLLPRVLAGSSVGSIGEAHHQPSTLLSAPMALIALHDQERARISYLECLKCLLLQNWRNVPMACQ